MSKLQNFIIIIALILLLISVGVLVYQNDNLKSENIEYKTIIEEKNKVINQKENIIEQLNKELNNENKLKEVLLNSLKIKSSQKKVNYFYGEATAYHPPSRGINSDNNPEITSIGMKAEVGIIAVNPNMIPYGSEVIIISGNKVIRGVAGDTGSAMMKNPKQLDILMESYKKAKEWGRRKVHVLYW